MRFQFVLVAFALYLNLVEGRRFTKFHNHHKNGVESGEELENFREENPFNSSSKEIMNLKGNDNLDTSSQENLDALNMTNFEGKSRTFSTISTIKNQISDAVENITLVAYDLESGIQSSLSNSTSGTSYCGSAFSYAWKLIKIPIFVITPAVIIGILILFGIIALITVWVPAWSGKFFEKWMSSGGGYADSDSSGYSQYGSPNVGYGTQGYSSGLSRQTAQILESIDNLSNAYGNSGIGSNGNNVNYNLPNYYDPSNANKGAEGVNDALLNYPYYQGSESLNYPAYYQQNLQAQNSTQISDNNYPSYG